VRSASTEPPPTTTPGAARGRPEPEEVSSQVLLQRVEEAKAQLLARQEEEQQLLPQLMAVFSLPEHGAGAAALARSHQKCAQLGKCVYVKIFLVFILLNRK
jgi:hypothetical protein